MGNGRGRNPPALFGHAAFRLIGLVGAPPELLLATTRDSTLIRA